MDRRYGSVRNYPGGMSWFRALGRPDSAPVRIGLTVRARALLRIVLAALFCATVNMAVSAAPPVVAPAVVAPAVASQSVAVPPVTLSGQGLPGDALETPDMAFSAALRQAIGAPARADLGDQATERLDEDLLIVPKVPAARLLAAANRKVPADFVALLMGPDGMETPGIIRFVPAGFVDADAALAWSADDFMASLKDTVEHRNPDRVARNLEERSARRWIAPPKYDPETHQISWSALILPKSAPRESDGEITFHAIAFGREGYITLTMVTGVQKADEVGHMVDVFLAGLNFRPGKAYGDAQPGDRRAGGGLAAAMGLDSLHKAEATTSFWGSDTVVPVAGSIVAGIGALALMIYIQRQMRRASRRI